MPRLFATLVLLLAVADAAPLRAETEADAARAHAVKAKRLFDLEIFDRAIEEYQAAYNLKGDPSLLFNIGQCHRLAGHLDLAVVYYKDYLQRSPRSPKRGEILTAIEALETEIAKKKAAEVPPPPPPPEKPPVQVAPPPRTIRYAAIGLIAGGALVALGGGLGFGLAASAKGDDVTRESINHQPFDPALESSGRLFQTLSYVGYAVGGAIAVAGAILFLLDARRAPARMQAALPLGFRF